MSDTQIAKTHSAAALLMVTALTALLSFGCTNGGTGTEGSPSGSLNNPSAAAGSSTATPGALEAKEPERYSVTTTVTIQLTGNSPQANVPPLQFNFARLQSDYRVSFRLPNPVGEVVYLEKAPLKYLIFPTRNEYVEMDPNELGFQLGHLLSPGSVVERLKQRAQHESLGVESVNGRPAAKYRFTGATDTRTQVGTVQADSIVYVDQETGIPLRSEVDTVSASGAGARIVTTTDNIQLAPESSLFEVPSGMKRVTSTELKQQVQGFVNALRGLAAYMRQQANPPQPGGTQ